MLKKLICVWYIFISKTTIFSVFNFCNTLAIFVLTFAGLVIILFQILLLEHEITTDRRLFRRNFFCVNYSTPFQAIGHQMLFFSPLLLTGHSATLLVTRWFTTCATDMRELFSSSGVFYLTLLPDFSRLSWGRKFKLKVSKDVVWNTFWLFVWIRQQSTNLIFSYNLYLNIPNILIKFLQWRA